MTKKKPMKSTTYLSKLTFADGGVVPSYDREQDKFGKEYNELNPYTYGMGPQKLYNFGTGTGNLITIPSGEQIATDQYNKLSDSAKFYLTKKWGNWANTDADTGQKGIADTLEDINRIIKFKGGQGISNYGQVDSALAPLIKKRNEKGLGGGLLGKLLPVAASFAVPFIGPALGITSALGSAALGAGLGAAAGGITSGSLKGALLGGAMGGAGGYLSNLGSAYTLAKSGPLAGQFVTPGTMNAVAQSGPLAGQLLTNQGFNVASGLDKLALTGMNKLGSLGKLSSLTDLLGGQQQGQQQSGGITNEQLMALIAMLQQQKGQYGPRGRNIGYAEGGLLQGPGTGTSDSIQGIVDGRTPVRLSNGEHITPALEVKMLGKGNPKAGSSKLEQIVKKELALMYGKKNLPKKVVNR